MEVLVVVHPLGDVRILLLELDQLLPPLGPLVVTDQTLVVCIVQTRVDENTETELEDS